MSDKLEFVDFARKKFVARTDDKLKFVGHLVGGDYFVSNQLNAHWREKETFISNCREGKAI